MKFFLAAVLTLCRISMANAENLLIVGEDEIRQAIEEEFVEQGQNQALDVEFFGGQTVFHIENAQKAKILVSGLKMDEFQNRFSCNAEIFADGKSYARTNITGRYFLLSEIWVAEYSERRSHCSRNAEADYRPSEPDQAEFCHR